MIKKIVRAMFVLAAITLVFACKEKKKTVDSSEVAVVSDTDSLPIKETVAPLEISIVSFTDNLGNYSDDTEDKSKDIEISYCQLKGEPQSVVDKHREDILAYLSECFVTLGDIDDLTEENLPDYISKEIQAFSAYVDSTDSDSDDFESNHTSFSFSVVNTFQNSKLVSLLYLEQIEGQWAHDIINIMPLNYKKEDASYITLEDLSSNINELKNRARKAFDEQEEGGFSEYFADEEFFLPEKFSFNSEGLVFEYNPPAMRGGVSVTLKKEDIKDIVPFFD